MSIVPGYRQSIILTIRRQAKCVTGFQNRLVNDLPIVELIQNLCRGACITFVRYLGVRQAKIVHAARVKMILATDEHDNRTILIEKVR